MKCTATNRQGNPCQKPAIAGAVVCRNHGGAAPQVRAKARQRLLSLVDPALGVLARATRRRTGKALATWEPSAQEIAAAREILDRAGINKTTTSELEQLANQETSSDDMGFRGTLEELLITLRQVTIETKPQ
jgi:hypothetical protein